MTRYTPNWLQQGTYPAALDRYTLGALWPGPASSGCAVAAASGMTVNIAVGKVAVPTANNTGTALCVSDGVESVTLAAAGGTGNNRIDLVICQLRGNDIDGGSNNDFIFTNVTGVAAGTPVAPAVPANAVALAQIYVPAGSASVTAGNITDVRVLLNPAAEPATTSATVVSRPDSTGAVWVARAGVNGGLWRRASDVLHAWVSRVAAATTAATLTTVPMDTVVNDPYGLLGASGLIPPVRGIYFVRGGAQIQTAAATIFNGQITQSGVAVGTASPGIAQGSNWPLVVPFGTALLTAGTPILLQVSSPTTGQTIAGSVLSIDYLGTG